MKPHYIKCLLIITLSFLMLACDENEESNYAHPHVVMKSIITVDARMNEPAKIFVVFENIGAEDGFDLSGLLSLHIGNTIIESHEFSIQEIVSRGSVTTEFWLNSVNNHNQYEYFSLDFTWYDYWGQVYE